MKDQGRRGYTRWVSRGRISLTTSRTKKSNRTSYSSRFIFNVDICVNCITRAIISFSLDFFCCWSVQDGLARKDSIIRQVGFLRLFSMYIQFGCCRKVDRASSSVGSITGQKRNLWIGDDLSSSVIGWLIVRQTISSNSASRLFVLFLLRTAEVREDRVASSELVWVW